MISVSNLGKSFGAQTLFRGVSFQLNPGQRYGLVGANGSGKSTLMRILAREEPPSEGTVSIPRRLALGVLRQDHFRFEEEPILHVVLQGNAELWEAMAAREEILARADESFDAERYAELEDIFVRHNGYTVEAQAAEILEGLGIPAEVHHQPLSTLSGGFKLRALLAQVLASGPGALLLDEPTNHLDILSIRWLEKFLQSFPGPAVVISHDHRFLENVCSHILDVDYETVTLYTGNYSDFERAKSSEHERRSKELAKREKEVAHHQAFVDRFRAKATKARQAQSKMRLIEKRQEDLKPLPVSSLRYPKFDLRQRRPSGRQALALEGISKSYGEHQVLSEVTLTVRRGERLAIIGPNGIGKSTLLKICLDLVQADAGEVEWGYETYPGYFAQDHHEQLGGGRRSVESYLWDLCPGEPIGFVRGQLAKVLFSREEVEKRLESLSGGEAARLLFAKLAVEQPNVLVLDEPTNHLDLEAIETLVAGLRAYDGTLIFVSHDRWLVSQLANRIVEITPQGLNDFEGSYQDYVAQCGDDHLDTEAVLLRVRREKRKAKSAAARRNGADSRKRGLKLTAERDRLTQEIEKAEARVHEINEIFCDPKYFERTPPPEVHRLEQEQKQVSSRVEELMGEWEKLEAELSSIGS